MINTRMLKIVRYLEKERVSGYKEIAEALGMKERTVRYDIECINSELSLKKAPLIEKYQKGMLFVPDELDFSVILEGNEFVFSPEERVSLIRKVILFDTHELNLRALSEEFRVSRRSIQNDIDTVQKELSDYGLSLSYDHGFKLSGESERSYELRCRELSGSMSMLDRRKRRTDYDKYVGAMLQSVFLPIDIGEIFQWIDEIMEHMGWGLSDDSYRWYVANVMTFTWYLKNDRELPHKNRHEKGEIDQSIGKYEKLVGKVLSVKERGILSGFTKYTKRYVNLDVNLDLVAAEDMAMELVKQMGTALHMDFSKDGILLKGLLNHIGPLLERMREDVQFDEDVLSLIPEEYQYVYRALKEILKHDNILCRLTENESIYLAIYFLGSLRRLQREQYKKVLLICGFGYGTTTVVKDQLRNEYQVYVRDSIPAHKIAKYTDWDGIDVVVSTVDVELPRKKPFALVNVVFGKEDYAKLELAGLHRKNVLADFLAIEKRLDFLERTDRNRVMEIIKEELGYKEVRVPAKYYKLTDLLRKEDIRCIKAAEDWQNAVRICSDILVRRGSISQSYYFSIIQGMQVQGFYCVTDNMFALLHGSETAGVKESSMSLLITENPVCFGGKKVNIIFCLASRDKKEHIPAVIRMMRMVASTDFIERLKQCGTKESAAEVVEECEKEVDACYQS